MDSESIQALIIAVPTCNAQDRLISIFEQLTTAEGEWLLIWDEDPVGALPLASLSQLMSAIICGLTQPIDSLPSHDSASAPVSSRDDAAPMPLLQSTLKQVLERPELRLQLKPLQLVPATWSVQEFKAYLRHYSDDAAQFEWVAVDAEQRPLGLLNPTRLAPTWNNPLPSQELMAQNAELVQTSQLKSSYLAYISHEVKNPITAMLGLSELLADSALKSLSDRQQRYIQLIRHNSQRLAAIANDMLDLSRVELGQLQLSYQSLSIRQLCDLAWQFQPRAAAQPPAATVPPSISIQLGLSEIVADKQRLVQMLAQLLANARRSTATFGEVGIAVEQWGQWYAFTIWDTGIGIPPERQTLLLQTLQPLENPSTHAAESGLGLVLTQRLVQLHGGDLTFVSNPGRSEFTLLLPPAPSHISAPPSPQSSAAAVQMTHPLAVVAEAAASHLTQLVSQLSDIGYRVAVARSGTEALQKVRRLHPKILFLDPVLPLLSGWDVLALVKGDLATRHIPTILSTASTAHPLERGQADAVLSLPSTPSALLQTLADTVPQGLHSSASAPRTVTPRAPSSTTLTVLYFNPSEETEAPSTIDFSGLLHPYGCRVLEVDDLDQAGLVAQVWKPNVALLGLSVPANPAYLRQLGQLRSLALLPMVVLEPTIAEAGHQAGLLVYPCLMSPHGLKGGASVDLTLLVQVIRVAAQGATLPPEPQ